MIVSYTLSFDDWLDGRDPAIQAQISTPPTFDGTLATVTAALSAVFFGWSLMSSIVIGSLVVISFGGITAWRFWQQNQVNARMATLRRDYEEYHSGSYTSEADEAGWRLKSIRKEQLHSWDDVQMFKHSPKTLFLMTSAGACTLPTKAFTPEELQQLIAWCGLDKEEL